MKFTMKIVNRVIGFQTLDWLKSLRSYKREVTEKNTSGMKIDTIKDPLLEFVVRVISHKFYQSSRLNSVPYIVVDVAYKLVKKDHTYDLSKLMMQ